MFSKFWVCIALMAAVAHTYVYKDLMKNSGNKASINMYNIIAKFKNKIRSLLITSKDLKKNSGNEASIDMYNIIAKFKNEMRSLLITAKNLSHSARQGIINFRKRTSEWRFERAKKLALDAAQGRI